MSKFTIRINEQPSSDDTEQVRSALRGFNDAFIPRPGWRNFVLTASDADGFQGGLEGELSWQWLFVRNLWVSAEHRGTGLGSRLIERAELYAQEQGCVGSHLDTFDFQARPFYERLGYEVFGTLTDFPPGHTRFFLRKRLDGQGHVATPT